MVASDQTAAGTSIAFAAGTSDRLTAVRTLALSACHLSLIFNSWLQLEQEKQIMPVPR